MEEEEAEEGEETIPAMILGVRTRTGVLSKIMKRRRRSQRSHLRAPTGL